MTRVTWKAPSRRRNPFRRDGRKAPARTTVLHPRRRMTRENTVQCPTIATRSRPICRRPTIRGGTQSTSYRSRTPKAPAARPSSQAPLQDRLLGVEAVLGFVEDDALRAVDDVVGHLFAAVRGQAVHE